MTYAQDMTPIFDSLAALDAQRRTIQALELHTKANARCAPRGFPSPRLASHESFRALAARFMCPVRSLVVGYLRGDRRTIAAN